MIAPWHRRGVRRDARALDALLRGEPVTERADPALAALARLDGALTTLAGPAGPATSPQAGSGATRRAPAWRWRALAGVGALFLALSGTGVAVAVSGPGGLLAPLHHAVDSVLGRGACRDGAQARLLDAAAHAIAVGDRRSAVADLRRAATTAGDCPAARRRLRSLDGELAALSPPPAPTSVPTATPPLPAQSEAPAASGPPSREPAEAPTEGASSEPTSTGEDGGSGSIAPAQPEATPTPSGDSAGQPLSGGDSPTPSAGPTASDGGDASASPSPTPSRTSDG